MIIAATGPTIGLIAATSLVGGVVGASIRFAFEDLLRPILGARRDLRRVLARYKPPIVRSADSLERRLNSFVRNREQDWFETDEWIRLGLLHAFGEHLAWVRIIERRFGFLPFEAARRDRVFNDHLYGVPRALTSHAYFRDSAFVEAEVIESALPRVMLTAIGEVMIEPGDEDRIVDFTVFARRYTEDAQFRQWFASLAKYLASARPGASLRWDRLIVAAAELRGLVAFLDPEATFVTRRSIANVARLDHAALITPELASRFGHLMPKARAQ